MEGARRDIVGLNASPLLCMEGKASDLKDGVEKAGQIIDGGLPAQKAAALAEAWAKAIA